MAPAQSRMDFMVGFCKRKVQRLRYTNGQCVMYCSLLYCHYTSSLGTVEAIIPQKAFPVFLVAELSVSQAMKLSPRRYIPKGFFPEQP